MHKRRFDGDEEEEQDQSAMGESAPAVKMYICIFCQRGFTSAQALGGHMNVHRRDRVLLKRQEQEIRELASQPYSSAAGGSTFTYAPAPSAAPYDRVASASRASQPSSSDHITTRNSRERYRSDQTPNWRSPRRNQSESGNEKRPKPEPQEDHEELDLELRLGDKKP